MAIIKITLEKGGHTLETGISDEFAKVLFELCTVYAIEKESLL